MRGLPGDKVWFGLMLNAPVNNFSVILGWSRAFWVLPVVLEGKYVLLKDTTRQPEWGSNPRPLNLESEVLTTRPTCPLLVISKIKVCFFFKISLFADLDFENL